MPSVSMLPRVAVPNRHDMRPRRSVAGPTVPPAVASPALPRPDAAREPTGLDAALARCVARRAAAVHPTSALLQRSCLKPTQRGEQLMLDEPDEQDVLRQGLWDGFAVYALQLRGAGMIAAARNSAKRLAAEESGYADVTRPGSRSTSSRSSGGGPIRNRHRYRDEPYSRDRVSTGRKSCRFVGGDSTSSYVQSMPILSRKSTAVGSIAGGGATAGATLTVPPLATHTVGAWNAGAHPGKAPDQRYGGTYALGAYGTATQAKLVRSYTRAGSGVGGTRPNDWTEFTALLGMTQNGQIAGKMRWIQGHFINEQLGGRGDQENLAPFTRSLNTRHYHAVEKHMIAGIGAGDTIDYSVQALPGVAGTQNETDAIAWHQAARTNYPQEMIDTLVAIGVLDATDAATLTPGAPIVGTTPTANSGAPTLGGVLTLAEAWIANYVQAVFPTAIACRARYYTLGPAPQGGGPVPATAKQVGEVLIDNVR
jgi:hypothetical protein